MKVKSNKNRKVYGLYLSEEVRNLIPKLYELDIQVPREIENFIIKLGEKHLSKE